MRLTHEGDLNLITDSKSINFGADSEVSLTHVHNLGLLLNSTRGIFFDDASNLDQFIRSGGSNVLQIASPTEIDITATTIDMNGNLDVSGSITLGGTAITSTAELNILDGVTSTASELNLVDGSTAGTVVASKAVVVDSNKDITGFRNITNTGTITASGDITAFSDERLKSDIETIDNALDKVMNMRGVSYTKQAEKGIGVIAQEIEKVLPEVVTDGEYKSVAYGNIVGVLIEAIKEQQKQIDKLKRYG